MPDDMRFTITSVQQSSSEMVEIAVHLTGTTPCNTCPVTVYTVPLQRVSDFKCGDNVFTHLTPQTAEQTKKPRRC